MAKDCRAPYVVYCFLGMAEAEHTKVFYWEQWEACFYLLDEILAKFAKTAWMKCLAAYDIALKPLKSDPPGTHRVTSKAVPLGRLRWAYEDNKKWSQKLEEPGPHPIRLLQTQILSSKIVDKFNDPKKNFPEFQVCVFNHSYAGAAQKHNQALTICVEDAFYRTRPVEAWDQLISRLVPIMRTVRLGRTVRPFYMDRPYLGAANGMMQASSLADCDFSRRYDELVLEDSWQVWEYLM